MSAPEATPAHAGGPRDLVPLDPDHPGFRDPVYRARRNAIARIALDYREGTPVPDAPYTEEEHQVWRDVWGRLGPLHAAKASGDLLGLQRALPLDRTRIPQLGALNPLLAAATGFRMEPVAGLVTARTFLAHLGRRVFLSTQYVRHCSRPLYTPEPDVIHELVGHAATLAHPGIAELNRRMGEAAAVADEAEVRRLERVYWFTLEFGVVDERGRPKAVGAGLLSSCGEIERFDTGAELLPWDLERMAATSYDPTDYQPRLYLAPSFERLLADVGGWVASGLWRTAHP